MKSPIGNLKIIADEQGICGISTTDEMIVCAEDQLLKKAVYQLETYFAGERKEFSLPLSLHGTEFQMKDWQALCTIPYGETRSYGQIAKQINSPNASRAVGMANHNNPVLIVVPCHRVIGASGLLTGYGAGIERKQYLLDLERRNSK